MADRLIGSEILRIAAEIRALRERGAPVCNLTVGDFSPASFPIPDGLRSRIVAALERGETNYPPATGVMALREGVRDLYRTARGIPVDVSNVVITGGSRPGIYATYRTLVDPGDRVVYPVPSWNNNHYTHLVGGYGVPVSCGARTGFLPTADTLAPVLQGARLLALNSPLNPSGTAFGPETLGEICDLVLEENARREGRERPLYLLYDQVYWMLAFGGEHVDPLGLRPEIAPFTVLIDGISKAFAATGLRVGWVVAPTDIAQRLADVVGHVGAWAPRAEQVATAGFLAESDALRAYREQICGAITARIDRLLSHLSGWQAAGLPVEVVSPTGGIYLSVKFALTGHRTPGGKTLTDADDVRRWLLQEAGLAVVPFGAFGVADDEGWCRLSVGAVNLDEIDAVMPRARAALESLRAPAS
jgi:aspartate aminotransferase